MMTSHKQCSAGLRAGACPVQYLHGQPRWPSEPSVTLHQDVQKCSSAGGEEDSEERSEQAGLSSVV